MDWLKLILFEFSTRSGILTAKKVPEANASSAQDDSSKGYFIELDFPVVQVAETNLVDVPAIWKTLDGASVVEINETSKGDLFILLPSGEAVTEFQPQFDKIQNCPARGIIITGPAPQGSGFDFYSSCFCPKLGVNEDPVCGSAHCALAPYWLKKLGKCDFVALAVHFLPPNYFRPLQRAAKQDESESTSERESCCGHGGFSSSLM